MTEPKIILFRVNDGINFKNSIHQFWGTKRGRANCLKTMVSKMNTGDICMFITNQENGVLQNSSGKKKEVLNN